MSKSNVFYFNPTCELAVANGSFSYMPPLLLQKMESDLSILPFIFANEKDFVLTEHFPAEEFIKELSDIGFKIPNFCSLSELESRSNFVVDSLIPWGWSPAAHFKLKVLKESCTEAFRTSPVFKWTEEHPLLFERKTSLDLLQKILSNNSPEWFISDSMKGEIVHSIEHIEERLKDQNELVIKAPLSSSGRGIQIIRKSKLSDANKQWISGILKQQKYLIAEPYLNKLADLSFQFEILQNQKIKYLGYSVFETNSNGQYKGTFIYPDWRSILPEENIGQLVQIIEKTAQLVESALQNSMYSKFHRGFLGVDALIFRQNEQLKIQPCIEVNCRMNMGILAKYIERALHREAVGKFELFYGKPGEYKSFVENQIKINPIQIKDGKLYSGFQPLIKPDSNKKFGAYIDLVAAR